MTVVLPVVSETLTSPSPDVSSEFAEKLVQEHFGLSCTEVELLTAERDQNLRLRDRDGLEWVLKIANPGEARNTTDFQTSVLCHLEAAAADLPVPRVLRTPYGATGIEATLPDGRRSWVRILTWVEGQPLVHAPKSSQQRRNLAICLARLGRGLSDFSHPAQDSYLQWDISHINRVSPLLPAIDDEKIRDHVVCVLQDFETKLRPVSARLRRQVIYNDLNFHNVLVDVDNPDRIAGIIDFGDIVAAPLINDLAVAASYQFGTDGNRDHAGEFIRTYHSELPLLDEEIRLLPLLIEMRLALTLLITGYRAKRHPENADYILRNNLSARAAISELRGRSPQENFDWITTALEVRA